MHDNQDSLDVRVGHFSETLRRAGIKVTHQRLEIFKEVARSSEHPDAETVFRGVRERMPTVSLDTVYRTLWLLLDLGLISTIGQPRERVRFDGNLQSHHHFVCTRCGRTRDFYSDELDSLNIPESVRDMGTIENTHVEIRGVCSVCIEREQ